MSSRPDPLILPDTVTLEYIAEGGANVIYCVRQQNQEHTLSTTTDLHSLLRVGSSTPPPTEISLSDSDGDEASVVSSDLLSSHLLRLRKAVPWLTSTSAQFESFDSIIRPLFAPEYLLSQYLVRLPHRITAVGNEKLRHAESKRTRPKKRAAVYLAEDEQYGLLVEDMRSLASSPRGALTIELKPKWLAQSPNAPKDAQKCRTCALGAMRHAKGGEQTVPISFCPLALLSKDREAVSEAVEAILAAQASMMTGHVDASVGEHLVSFFLDTPLLLRLRELQTLNDPHGILDPSIEEPDGRFRLAMTLRDCTLYVRVRAPQQPSRDMPTTEARLGDLDLKLSEPSKVAYWKDIEQELCKGGWYYIRADSHKTVSRCQLQRR